MITTNLFVFANVKQLRTGGSFRILLPFFRTSWGVGVLNSAIFNSSQIRGEFGTILEGVRNFGGLNTLNPPRYATEVHPRTGHEGTEREYRYSSTLSLISALGGVGSQRHALAIIPPGKDPVPIVQEAGWAPGPVWTGAENLASTAIRSPDRPARIASLYRLSYPTII